MFLVRPLNLTIHKNDQKYIFFFPKKNQSGYEPIDWDYRPGQEMNFEKVETTLIIKYFPDLSRILSQKKKTKSKQTRNFNVSR